MPLEGRFQPGRNRPDLAAAPGPVVAREPDPNGVPRFPGVLLPAAPAPGAVVVDRDLLGRALAWLLLLGVGVGVVAIAWSVAKSRAYEEPGTEDPANPPPAAGEGGGEGGT